MKSAWSRIAGLVFVLAISVGMIVPGLSAGPSMGTASFKLPFDAKMGGITLPKGDYTISVNNHGLGAVSVFSGVQGIGMVFPQSFASHQSQTEKPTLVCVRHDGNVAVRALNLPNVGTYYFPLPKELKTLSAQQPQLIETVTVEVAGQ
jgi:hypothetical protein